VHRTKKPFWNGTIPTEDFCLVSAATTIDTPNIFSFLLAYATQQPTHIFSINDIKFNQQACIADDEQ
jgi:hypothetical protein